MSAASLRLLVNTKLNLAITVCCAAWLLLVFPGAFRWTIVDAVWSGTADDCRRAGGACWAYVAEKSEFFIFGFYPRPLVWRPTLASFILVLVIGATLVPRLWSKWIFVAWAIALPIVIWLFGGGFGLFAVSPDAWGGLPLTLLLCTGSLVAGFPLGILLALGRRSQLTLLRFASTGFIELWRGVPMVAVLFTASVLVPLMVPEGVTPGKLLRAYLAFTAVAAAYFAEAVRAGLLAVPTGQYEAAKALGLRYWHINCLIVLPQALKVCLPVLINIAVVFLKDTSLVIVIGLYELIGSVNAAAHDPNWIGFDVEGYLFAAAIYLSICLAMTRYASWLERRIRVAR